MSRPWRLRQNPLANLTAFALFLLFAAATGCAGSGEPAAYLLIDHLGTAAAPERGGDPPQVSFIELGFDQRRALLQPPSVYRFDDVPSGNGAVFSTAPVLGPIAWRSEGDGVGVEVRCAAPNGGWRRLLSLRLERPETPAPRRWEEQQVPLDSCTSPTTTLELETNCGPDGDCRYDRAAWACPQVIHDRQFQPRFKRLVVLISIDTLRPDHLSIYGYDRLTSPRLQELARDAVVFDTTVAQAPWTIPSHASLLTSTSPEIHGATSTHDIRAEVPLLSEILHAAGWTTAGFVDTSWLDQFGFTRGYDHYDAETPPPGSFRRGAQSTRERIARWLPRASGDVFVFWHLMDVHGPYGAPAPYGGRFRAGLTPAPDGTLVELGKLEYHNYLRLDRFRSFEDLVATYDEGIAYVDAEIGSLLDLLRQAGLYDEALIVVTSDHGESLLDHGVWVGHGLFLTDDEIRVPLLVKLPGNRHAGMRVEHMVRLIDVAPTILDIVGQSAPPSFEGISLVSPRPGAPAALPRIAYGISSNNGSLYIRNNRLKLITDWSSNLDQTIKIHLRPREPTSLTRHIESGERLFDLLADPGEEHNLTASGERGEEAAALRHRLEAHGEWLAELERSLDDTGQASLPELSSEQIRQLKSLGYLGGVDR